MSAFSILGMVIGVAFLMFGAYRGIKAIPLTVVAAVIVILTNGLPIWQTLATTYATGFGATITSYFFIFCSSSVYAIIMEKTGCATAIGNKFIDWFGTKYVMLISMLLISVLTYGGVSLFVVLFATLPILFILFRDAGLPRHAIFAPVAAGSSTYTMTMLPGTPALTNVIPSQFLGTPMTAAPFFSIAMSALTFVMCYMYCMYVEKKARTKGQQWSYPEGYDVSVLEIDRSKLPSATTSFIPIIFLVAFIIIGSVFKANIPFAQDAALLTTLAMLIGAVMCILLNLKRLSVGGLKDMIGTGSLNGISAIIGLASVVAFGGVVSSSPAFQDIVAWVLSVDLSPYWKGIFATAVIAGITGSSSGGVRIALTNMAEYFMGTGANMELLHRCMSIAAGSLDSLPHSSGIFLMMQLLGLTHKEGYFHIFVQTVVIPAIVSIVAGLIAGIIG